jgi:hypothetical protein
VLLNQNIFTFSVASRFFSSKYSTLISVSYESPFFTNYFKKPFTVSLVCMYTNLHFTVVHSMHFRSMNSFH